MTGDKSSGGGEAGGDYEIAVVAPPALPGLIGLAACPGVRHGRFRPDLLKRDLDEVERWGTTALLCLILEDEIEALPLERLVYEVRNRGIVCAELQVAGEAPSEAVPEREWARVRGRLVQALRNGQRLLIPCTEGRGRTGRVAAWLMMEGGATADEAIAAVRAACPDMLGSAEEEASVRAYTPQAPT